MKKIATPSLSLMAQRCSSWWRFNLWQLLLGDVPGFSPSLFTFSSSPSPFDESV
jgi:hypothetical protein